MKEILDTHLRHHIRDRVQQHGKQLVLTPGVVPCINVAVVVVDQAIVPVGVINRRKDARDPLKQEKQIAGRSAGDLFASRSASAGPFSG